MSELIDPTEYLRLPRIDAAAARSLGRMLIMLAPKRAGADARAALEELHDRLAQLDAAWVTQAEVAKRPDARPHDRRVDALFGAVRDRLEHYRVLTESRDRSRALEILETVFADGLGFLRLSFAQQHAEGERRLALIKKHDLKRDLEQLVGKRFVDELYEAQTAYGAVLGITAPVDPAPASTRIAEPLRAVFESIGTYVVHLISLARAHPERTADVERALSPIDKFRRSGGSVAGTTDTPVNAAAPLPTDAPPPDSPLPPVSPEA